METGEGGSVNIEGKTLKVPSFKRPSAMKDPDSDWIEQIEKGGEGMPGFKDKLSTDEIKGIVKFMRKEFQGK
jgi:mono/diheme cytochrome c family protein